MPAQLKEQPKIPEGFQYLMEWYFGLQNSERLTYQEIDAWNNITRKSILPWEAEILISIDRVFWRVING